MKLATNSHGLTINREFIDVGSIINVQSGGTYSNNMFVEPNGSNLRSDCIVLNLGTLYKNYNSFVGRTLLIDPTENQKISYKKALLLVKVIQQNLRPGVAIQSIYKKAAEFVAEHFPGSEVPKSFGFGTGTFLMEQTL